MYVDMEEWRRIRYAVLREGKSKREAQPAVSTGLSSGVPSNPIERGARAILLDYRILGEGLWSRFTGGKEDSLWYYRTITDILLKQGPNQLAAELDRVVTEIERLAGQKA